MSRAAVPGLPSPHPIGDMLPALYADDDFAQRFTAGLDTVLAPVFAALDNLPAYFQPRLAPADFLAWLADWVGMEADPAWPEEVRRTVVERAVELHRWRGTRRGLQERLRLSLGVGAQIVDGGGVSWSTTPDPTLPLAPSGELLVRVWPIRTPEVDEAQVLAVVRASCPVHLTCRVQILPGPPGREES
ncbi:phage tail protein [Streptantibioticus ferralitis]|uniref:Phage tail protein n=1 Tax=Streptantibioticus ferralitis TaxID=236510 RepID=A0ABT5Z3G9_9ACTN|nr:phage tail protein [Streptantibioticus ferralitis]MDF2257580.1 phage tail protein [Streptantibioticus ferralitis]